jgi:hypothetical protein
MTPTHPDQPVTPSERALLEQLHAAVCNAVAVMNVAPAVVRNEDGRKAHNILRQALTNYADGYDRLRATEPEGGETPNQKIQREHEERAAAELAGEVRDAYKRFHEENYGGFTQLSLDGARDFPLTDTLRNAMQIMVASAEQIVSGEDVIGYRIKTGALHRIIGLLGLTVPVNLPSAVPASSGDGDICTRYDPTALVQQTRLRDQIEDVCEEQIKHMVNRFLGWRLPKPWNPDNGISYARPNYAHAPADHDWPVGTNLFDATQAEAMVRYMLDGMPHRSAVPASASVQPVAWLVRRHYPDGGYTDWLFKLESETHVHKEMRDTIIPLFDHPPQPPASQPVAGMVTDEMIERACQAYFVDPTDNPRGESVTYWDALAEDSEAVRISMRYALEAALHPPTDRVSGAECGGGE